MGGYAGGRAGKRCVRQSAGPFTRRRPPDPPSGDAPAGGRVSNGWEPLKQGTGRRVAALPELPLSIGLDASPFVRLARTHVLSAAGDTCVTIALAGSLFFDISPDAAKGKVALSLVLTVLPFGVVAPFLGPAMDRFTFGRRFTVFGAACGRAGLSLVMAVNLNSLALFPLVFLSLILSRAHTVSKAALVPATVRDDGELVAANSKLALCGGLAAFAASLPAGGLLKLAGGAWTLRFGAVLFAAAAVCAFRLSEPSHDAVGAKSQVHQPPSGRGTGPEPAADATAPALAQPGDPTVAMSRKRSERRRSLLGGSPDDYGPGIVPAATAMAVLRGVVGFMTFFIAFSFRRVGAPSYWFGLAIGASAVGNLVGAFLAPRLRSVLKEEHIVLGSLGLLAVLAIVAGRYQSKGSACALALVVGVAAACARLAFDSLVQRDNPSSTQGRVFARFEAVFQLVWVSAALVPVLATVPLRIGCFLVAVASALGALAYAAELRGLRRLGPRRAVT